jgi:hypothetical protein
MLRLVAGVRPAKAGCRKVLVAPRLGRLDEIDAGVPLPTGLVAVKLRRVGTGVAGSVTLSEGVTGTFRWNGKSMALTAGENKVETGQ